MGGPGSGRRSGFTPDDISPITPLHPFSGAKFVAWISNVVPTRSGIKINMMVKYQDREDVKVLWDAIGMPVEVEVHEWEAFREAKTALGDGIVIPD